MLSVTIDPFTTALVLIDLQYFIVARETKPYSASTVVANAALLADGFRRRRALVIYVHVELADMLSLPVDQPNVRDPNGPALPANACDIVPEAGITPSDIVISKRQWGAFYGTNLEQQLRRKNIRTILLGGIATNIGVESTARAAFDQGFALLFAEDAMASMSSEAHHFATQTIFPRMGHVRTTEALLRGLPRL